MTEDQIKHMTERFLNWRLPDNFAPDGGITFEQTYAGFDGNSVKREPVGTNLLNYNQAKSMVLHMLAGLPE